MKYPLQPYCFPINNPSSNLLQVEIKYKQMANDGCKVMVVVTVKVFYLKSKNSDSVGNKKMFADEKKV